MPSDLFESIVDQVVAKTIDALLTKERQFDIIRIGKNWDFYNGDQEQYVKRYYNEDLDEYLDKDKPTFNYTKLVIDEYVSGVFARPVEVLIDSPQLQERWGEIANSVSSFSNILPYLKKVQRIAEISNTCISIIRYDKDRKIPYFEDVRGEFVHFIPDQTNPKLVGALVIAYNFDTGSADPDKRIMQRIEIISDDQWEVWMYSPTLRMKKKVQSVKNPYGFIPAVSFRPEEDDNSFYGISQCSDVVKINEVYNNLWTALARITVFQSFSILVIKTDSDIKIQVAPTRYLKLPNIEGNASAEYITPDAKIKEVAAVLKQLKGDLQDFSRVPASVFASSEADGGSLNSPSGYSLKIKRIPIEEVWNSRRQSYGPAYTNMIEKALVVDAIASGRSLSVDDFKTTIEFQDTTPSLALDEQMRKDMFDLRYGLLSPVDIYLRSRKRLTRDEALEELKKKQQETKALNLDLFGEGEVKSAKDLKNMMNSGK